MYTAALILHLLAALLWLGHMFAWPLVVGPALKRAGAESDRLRAASLWLGGLGWPALLVLIPTGLFLLWARGIAPTDLLAPATYAALPALAVKLAAVLYMIAYQVIFGHRPAPRAIYTDIAAALLVLAASVLLVRGVA